MKLPRATFLGLQRTVLAADRGPAHRVLGFAYEVAALAYAAYARRGLRGAAAYVRGTMGSRDTRPGLTDIDLVLVTPADPGGTARTRARKRCREFAGAVPVLGKIFDVWPLVFDQPGIEDLVNESALTYGLADGRSAYCGPNSDTDKIRALERPGLYDPRDSWRLLAGPDLRPVARPPDPPRRRIAAWLELQNWWRWAAQACIEPERPGSAYTCVKIVAESARIWLWLVHGEVVGDRSAALRRGAVELPGEGDAFERARYLERRLQHARRAPLSDFLPAFLGLSTAIARELTRQLAQDGATVVRLVGSVETLALPHGGLPPDDEGTALPLVDWRAIAMPSEPDDAFSVADGDPADPCAVAATATALDCGPYLTLRTPELLLRPTPIGGRGRLRSIQCEATDPVSFALLRGERTARFPNAPGWSIDDVARRAVAEHREWLLGERPGADGLAFGRLIKAARAGLLAETSANGEPELALTASAALDFLAARRPTAAEVAAEADAAYRRFAVTWSPPSETLVRALRDTVLTLPAYANPQPIPQAA